MIINTFRFDAGDQTLANHLSSSPKSATYISKTTQNLLIGSCGKAIEKVLIKNVKHSIFLKFFVMKQLTAHIVNKRCWF